jgi:hypothetical protein
MNRHLSPYSFLKAKSSGPLIIRNIVLNFVLGDGLESSFT